MIPPGSPAHYMKKYLLCVLILLAPAALRAQDFIRIDHVGLGSSEILTWPLPTPVRVHIPALSQSQTLQLQFQLEVGEKEKEPRRLLSHRFMKQVQVSAGAPSDFDVPLYLPTTVRLAVDLTVTDAGGNQIGRVGRDLDVHVHGGERVIVIYCAKEGKCDEAASEINSGFDDEEQTANAKSDTKIKIRRAIVTLTDPYTHWWDFSAADSVVLAAPTAGLAPEKLSALEQYARAGGTILILESEVADKKIFAAYRQGPPTSAEIPIGLGRLIRVPGLGGADLRKRITFTTNTPTLVYTDPNGVGTQPSNFFLSRTGISFTFPPLRWLMIWMGIFIVVIGPLNFFILRRIRKLEWGWITISGISVLFAGGLYLANSVSRPKDFMLDDAAIYRMDDRSPLATANYGFRVYSPERRNVILSVNRDSIPYDMDANRTFGDSGINIGAGFTGGDTISAGWRVHLDMPLQFDFPMLRWSTEDFNVRGFREFPGTVHWTSETHLKNDTGQNFQQAIYMDFKANKQYLIPRMASGEEIDVNSIIPKIIFDSEEAKGTGVDPNILRYLSRERSPFSLTEVPYEKLQYSKDSQVFAGWAEGQPLNASLDAPIAPHTGAALIIVTLQQQQCPGCIEGTTHSK
jgi:hypothetical protein